MDTSGRRKRTRKKRGVKPAGRIGDHPAMRRIVARMQNAADTKRERLAVYLESSTMAKQRTVAEQLRAAIDASKMSRYAICQATGIPQSHMSRFMGGERGLSMESIDTLCRLLELELRPVRRRIGIMAMVKAAGRASKAES